MLPKTGLVPDSKSGQVIRARTRAGENRLGGYGFSSVAKATTPQDSRSDCIFSTSANCTGWRPSIHCSGNRRIVRVEHYDQRQLLPLSKRSTFWISTNSNPPTRFALGLVFELALFPDMFTVSFVAVKNTQISVSERRQRGRPPHLKHPLGVLRRIIGKTQQEFARLLGDYSHHTIEAIERGALQLSEGLAQQISEKTGINLGWLLRGDPKAPPLDTHERPYTKETFERIRFRGLVIDHPPPGDPRLLGIMASAGQKGTVDLCDYRLTEALDVLERRFGHVHNVKSVEDMVRVLFGKPESQNSAKAFKARRKHTKESGR